MAVPVLEVVLQGVVTAVLQKMLVAPEGRALWDTRGEPVTNFGARAVLRKRVRTKYR